MNLQYVKAFMAVVEHKSLSGAARALFISQSTISFQLEQLEKELDVQLLLRERGRRSVELTAAGQSFLPLAQQWVDLDRQTELFKARNHDQIFRISTSFLGHEYLFTNIIHKLVEAEPLLKFQLIISEFQNVHSSLYRQESDVAFVFGRYPEDPLIEQKLVFREDRCIICSASSVLPQRKLTPEDLDPAFEVRLAKITFAPNEISDPTFPKRLPPAHKWVKDNLPGDVPPLTFVRNLSLTANYLIDPRAWAIFPMSLAAALVKFRPDLYSIRDVEPMLPYRDCYMVTSRTYPETPARRQLLQCINEYIDETPYLHRPDTE